MSRAAKVRWLSELAVAFACSNAIAADGSERVLLAEDEESVSSEILNVK